MSGLADAVSGKVNMNRTNVVLIRLYMNVWKHSANSLRRYRPFLPTGFSESESCYRKVIELESVHFTDFPEIKNAAIDLDLEERMKLAQDASSLILSIRKKINIKVRQPLKKVLIPVLNPGMKIQLGKS